nr:hypothetical protein [uncultured Flavobacterium sp.]
MIHAFLNVLRVDFGANTLTLSQQDLSTVIQQHLNDIGSPDSQLEFMTETFAPVISSILLELKNSLFTSAQIYALDHPAESGYGIYLPTNSDPPTNSGISTPWIWTDYFKYQSYEGLHNSQLFKSIFPDNSVGKYYFNSYISVVQSVTCM